MENIEENVITYKKVNKRKINFDINKKMEDFVKLHKTVVEGNKTIVILDNSINGSELGSSLMNSQCILII